MKKNFFAALAVVSVLLLTTGCGEEETLQQGGAGGSGGGGSSNSDPNGNNGDDADGNATAEPVVTLEGKDCFPGSWLADNVGFQALMESVSGGAKISTTGNVFIDYKTDGTNVTNYDHWTHTITIDGGTSVVERHGIDNGIYSANSDGTFTGSDTSVGSVTTMTVTPPGGPPISMSVAPEPSVLDAGTYTCSGDVLMLTVDGYQLRLDRQS